MKKVAIIGGSDFIDSDIISLLLNAPFYVKVSTSDISKKETYEHLMELKGSEKLHVCELERKNQTALNSFISNCDHVIFLNPSDI
jgi:hypothetical protein